MLRLQQINRTVVSLMSAATVYDTSGKILPQWRRLNFSCRSGSWGNGSERGLTCESSRYIDGSDIIVDIAGLNQCLDLCCMPIPPPLAAVFLAGSRAALISETEMSGHVFQKMKVRTAHMQTYISASCIEYVYTPRLTLCTPPVLLHIMCVMSDCNVLFSYNHLNALSGSHATCTGSR